MAVTDLSSATDLSGDNIFVINDVDLVIPPSAISVQKEDLTYSWKTLRTRQSTKIPTGHGQVVVGISMPFTSSQLLSMHRLIVEVQQSPYVYIENRFLRESICPHWSLSKSMAFTVQALDIQPMGGSSDTWVMAMQMTWFNYEPFSSSFEFKDDWVTEWLTSEDSLGSDIHIKQTIGWSTNRDGEREYKPRVVAFKDDSVDGPTIKKWDVIQQEFEKKSQKTIQDMGALHLGAEWDLLPLPGNMQMAKKVKRPSRSRIYTRYINLLQRDALKASFEQVNGGDLDIEQMLMDEFYGKDSEGARADISNAFFGVLHTTQGPRTYGLHSGGLLDAEMNRAWRRVVAKVIKAMYRYNNRVMFTFDMYMGGKIEHEAKKSLREKQRAGRDQALAEAGMSAEQEAGWLTVNEYEGAGPGHEVKRVLHNYPVRRGFTPSEDNPLHSPLQSESGKYFSWSELAGKITSRVSVRDPAKVKEIYGTNESVDRLHLGTDVSAQAAERVCAMKNGRVTFVRRFDQAVPDANLAFWKVRRKTGVVDELTPSELQDLRTLLRVNNINTDAPAGTYLRAPAEAYFYKDVPNAAGQNVKIEHDDGTYARYLHLSALSDDLFANGGTVVAGQVLGIVGATSGFSRSWVNQQFKAMDSTTSSGTLNYVHGDDSDSGFTPRVRAESQFLAPHLHFEYWEPEEFESARTPDYSSVESGKAKKPGFVPVDPVPSWENADDADGYERLFPEGVYVDPRTVPEETPEDSLEDSEPNDLTDGELLYLNVLDAGWRYYEDNTNVKDVWQKTIELVIGGSPGGENDKYPKGMSSVMLSSAVLSGCSGGLRHVMSSIPILGHEYPTQQHLGSVEPEFSFEFALQDAAAGLEYDQSEREARALEGLPVEGRLLEAMRSTLQGNARKFRKVRDGWCVATDSFITRLFGTYKANDKKSARTDDGALLASELQKRTTISRAQSGTVQGNPGLSYLHFDLCETNPYQDAKVIQGGGPGFDMDEARADVLKAVKSLKLVDNLKSTDLLLLHIAQTQNPGTTDSGDSVNFGLFDIPVADNDWVRGTDSTKKVPFSPFAINNGQYGSHGDTSAPDVGPGSYAGKADTQSNKRGLVVRDQDGQWASLLNSLDIDFTAQAHELSSLSGAEGNILSVPFLDTFNDALAASGEREEHLYLDQSRTYRKFDISNFLDRPDIAAIKDLPIVDILEAHQVVNELCAYASILISDDGSKLAQNPSGGQASYYGTPVSAREVDERLWGLGIRGQMWQAWQLHLENVAAKEADSDMYFRGGVVAIADMQRNPNYAAWRDGYGTSKEVSEVTYKNLIKYPTATTTLQAASSAITEVTERVLAPTFSSVPFVGSGVEGYLDSRAANHLAKMKKVCTRYISNLNLRTSLTSMVFEKWGLDTFIGRTIEDLAGGFDDAIGPIAGFQRQLQRHIISCGYFRTNFFDTSLVFAYYPAGHEKNTLPEIPKPPYRAESDDLAISRESLRPSHSPFLYKVDSKVEESKVEFFRREFQTIADKVLGDASHLKAYGLEKYALFGGNTALEGSDAYLDMDLPVHPYYGDGTNMGPDFYMWSMYEDGGALNNETLVEIQRSVDTVIANSYKSMQELQGGIEVNPAKDKLIQDRDTSLAKEQLVLSQKFSAEGTDGDYPRSPEVAPMDSPFYPLPGGEEEERRNDFFEKLGTKASDGVVEGVSSVKPPAVRLDNYEGPFGLGGGVDYPRRTSGDTYQKLLEDFNNIDSMMGSREGHLSTGINEQTAAEITNSVEGTRVERLPDSTHRFDNASLSKLARDASVDMVSRKVTMRRAYPTFKFYIVDENTVENRLLAYDDFHSYNGVKEFSVVLSRKLAADVAVITLQNVAGSLDGTRQDGYTDLDHYGKPPEKRVADPEFDAVVLRPGLNVQLRAGYANSPNDLHVLISGRIVDLTWNKQGDLAEIMVQSFGSELVQHVKGNRIGDKETVYATTHQLLGAMMLEPELRHFGRWEFGQKFQVREGKDSRLDFTDYSRMGSAGVFTAPQKAMAWFLDSPTAQFTAAALGIGINFLGGGIGKGLKAAIGRAGATKGFFSMGGQGSRAGVKAWQRWAAQGSKLKKAEWPSDPQLLKTQVLRAADEAQDIIRDIAKARRGVGFADAVPVKAAAEASETLARKLAEGIPAKDAIKAYRKKLRKIMARGILYGDPTLAFGKTAGIMGKGTLVGKGLSNTLIKPGFAGLAAGVGTASLAGVGVDVISQTVVAAGVSRVKKFVALSKVSLFLSPQDDNLYPPHPKDYMDWDPEAGINIINATKKWALSTAASMAAGTLVSTDVIDRLFNMGSVADKRVAVEDCRYKLTGSTVWDIFHEMTLRHPGWVYGTRPYGGEFRYTMFFGVPTQRYWAKPASNLFIDRMNTLYGVIREGDVNERQYRGLYGDLMPDGETKIDDEKDIKKNPMNALLLDSEGNMDTTLLEQKFTARAIKEYLRGLEIRFVPFRRFHTISSDVDLVWNGIMNSENAGFNAVEVTYYNKETSGGEAPVGTRLVKAHSTLSPHTVRSQQMNNYRNVYGEKMAARYGQGGLVYSLKDMYRGEIITLGNPRIRPWDQIILQDYYNDIMGPVEVEQVVHNFSFQTGFITEIKPSAVVIANETSSWPLLEAMKMWALAVTDIQNLYSGARATKRDSLPSGPGLFENIEGEATEIVKGFLELQIQDADEYTYLRNRLESIYASQGGLAAVSNALQPLSSEQMDRLDGAFELAKIWNPVTGAGPRSTLWAGGLATGIGTIGALGGGGLAVTSKSGLLAGAGAGVALLGAGVATLGAASMHRSSRLNNTSMQSLIGGTLLLLNVMREQSVIMVPLLKNGEPIVSGFSYQDPSMLYKNFAGQIKSYVRDSAEGTLDLLHLWSEYGTNAWSRLPGFFAEADDIDLTGN